MLLTIEASNNSLELSVNRMRSFIVLVISTTVLFNLHSQTLVDINFNSISDLTTYFNDDGVPAQSNIGNLGISNSGSVLVPFGTSDNWTLKQGYLLCNNIGDTYTIEAYFRTQLNSGYGGLGFAALTQNIGTAVWPGHVNPGMGVTFHGGGATFHNSGANSSVSWFPAVGDLVPGNWYQFKLIINVVGVNTYDMTLEVFNSDSSGNLGPLFITQTNTGVVNTLFNATIYPYFSAYSNRMDAMDNFVVTQECTILLPIEILSFEATPKKDKFVNLMWQTASEVNNDFFTIEKSVNIIDWIEVTKVDGSGNATTTSNYSAIDQNPFPGTSYYRLKQTDFNGQYSYSEIKTVEIVDYRVRIYPNPTNAIINVEGSIGELSSISILNLLGQNVNGQVEFNSMSPQRVSIDLSKLENGVYLLKTKSSTTEIMKSP